MGKKAAAVLFAVFVAAVCVGAVMLVPVYKGGARDLKPVPDPKETVAAFFDSVKNGEFEKAAEYLSNYSSLGMDENDSGDSISKKLGICLDESYDYEIKECTVKARKAEQRVEFTFLPVESIAPELQRRAEAIAYETQYDGTEIDEEKALEILETAFDELMKNEDVHTVTRDFTLTLDYDGEKWLIKLPARLLSAISGIDIQEENDE